MSEELRGIALYDLVREESMQLNIAINEIEDNSSEARRQVETRPDLASQVIAAYHAGIEHGARLSELALREYQRENEVRIFSMASDYEVGVKLNEHNQRLRSIIESCSACKEKEDPSV